VCSLAGLLGGVRERLEVGRREEKWRARAGLPLIGGREGSREADVPPQGLPAAAGMQRRSSKSGKGGKKLPTAYSKADAFGGSKYEVSHIVGKGAYGVVWCDFTTHAAFGCLQTVRSAWESRG
jgi:hypothetical protein